MHFFLSALHVQRVIQSRGRQPPGRGPVPVRGLVGTGPRKKSEYKKLDFFFFNRSEKYIILKKDRIHPCVRLSRIQES